MPAGARSSDESIRDALGIGGEVSWYKKYEAPLFEVQFKTKVELDVPLPRTHKVNTGRSTPLGTMDPETHHVLGAGKTKGGVPEGIMPTGVPIEIVSIKPVGTPRASYPPTGKPYGPYAPAKPSVRNLGAPLTGSTSGTTRSRFPKWLF